MTEEDVSDDNIHLSMEPLGEILHFSKSGRLIVKIYRYKPIIKSGLSISDDQEKKIGKISELLGPIHSPYASIIPYIQKRNKLTGTKVFINESLKNNYRSKTSRSKTKIKRNKK